MATERKRDFGLRVDALPALHEDVPLQSSEAKMWRATPLFCVSTRWCLSTSRARTWAKMRSKNWPKA